VWEVGKPAEHRRQTRDILRPHRSIRSYLTI
jgi:hypothetical protein